MSRKQKIIGGSVLLVLLLASGLTFALTSSSSSSASNQVVVLSKVQRRTLQGTVSLTGTLERKDIRDIDSASTGIVTAMYADDGTTVQPGTAMFSVNGRDAIAEQGTTPFYRTLTPGDSGPDVTQLKEILDAAGDYTGPMSDMFTEQTQFALAQWQAQHGYPNSTPATPESVTVSLEQGSGYKIGDDDSAGLTIGPPAASTTSLRRSRGTPSRYAVLDASASVVPHTVPTLTIQSVDDQVPQGQPMTFVITASEAPSASLTVNLTSGGSAGSDDIVTPPTSVTMPTDATTTTVTVQTRVNSVVGPNTNVILSLAGGSGYVVGSPSSAETTITDDNVPSLQITGGATVSPGGSVTLTVSANQAPVQDTQVALSFSGNAVAGTDYVVPDPVLTLGAGSTSTSVTIDTIDNDVIEPSKYLVVSISPSPTNYSVGSSGSTVVTIGPGTTVPSVTITGGTTVSPGGSVTLTVSANQAPVQDTPVALSFSGNAVAGTDYVVPDPVITLGAGSTSTSVTIDTIDNDVIEPSKYLVVSISPSPTNYSVGSSGSTVVTIGSRTTVPSVTLTSAINYLQKGQPYVVSVGLSESMSSTLTIGLTYGGTAVEGVDFVPPAGTIVVPAGQTSLTVQIPTITDNLVESDRTLTVSIAPSSAYTTGTPSSTSVTITSSVVPELNISASAPSVAAGGAASFTITANEAPVMDTSVNFSVQGTAEPGQNYEPLAGTALLSAGKTSVTVVLQTLQSNIDFEPTDMIVGSWPTKVGDVYLKAGEAVEPGTPILELTEQSLGVTLQASAADRTMLAVGQTCTVQINGENNQYQGAITELDSTETTIESSTPGQAASDVYEGQIQAPGLTGADGSAVSITVVTQQETDAVTVPIAAVKQNGLGADVVRVIDLARHDQITEVPVTTGLSEGSYIQIDKGLHVGETVVVEVDQS